MNCSINLTDLFSGDEVEIEFEFSTNDNDQISSLQNLSLTIRRSCKEHLPDRIRRFAMKKKFYLS